MPPSITFVNHSSVIVDDGQGTRLLSDPWLDGLVFNKSWSLLCPSPISAADFGSVTHLWISHEHPDHFHPPTLKKIPEADRARMTVLHQATDLASAREIKGYCAKLGFREFVDLPPDRHVELGANLKMLCRHHLWGDSWGHFKLSQGDRPWTILNANDCEWATADVAEAVFSELGPVDLLLMQFSYACWYPDRDARRREAERLIERLVMMTRLSGARYVFPFASLVYFCHEENHHQNDEMVTMRRAAETIATRTPAQPVVLYPGETWTLGAPLDYATALARYEQDETRVKSATLVRADTPLPLEDLNEKLAQFWEKNRVPGRERPEGLSVYLHLRDLGRAVHWRGDAFEPALRPERDCDLSLASDTLAFLLDNRYGAATLNISARFALPEGSRFPTTHAIEHAVLRALGRRTPLIAGSVQTLAYGEIAP